MASYNSPQLMIPFRKTVFVITLAIFLFSIPGAWAAGGWEEPASELGKKIVALAGPGTASLEVHNAASLPNDQLPAIRRALEQQLRAEGVQLRPAHEAATNIRVLFSENPRGWLWIAEVRQGNDLRVAMLELPGDHTAAASQPAALISLRNTLLLSSSEPLLDVQPLAASPNSLVALTPSSAIVYERAGGKLQAQQTLPIKHANALPRDPRGRLVIRDDHPFDVFLPGTVCNASSGPPLALACLAGDDPWPLGNQAAFFNSARNYFTGVLAPGVGRTVPPFYSAASLPRPKYSLWVFTGTDGQGYAFNGVNLLHLGNDARTWGSDITALLSGCGSGTQILATANTANGDEASDSITAYEIVDRQPTPASAPLTLNGTITALWASRDNTTATAIVRTPQGGYDAYSISMACN